MKLRIFKILVFALVLGVLLLPSQRSHAALNVPDRLETIQSQNLKRCDRKFSINNGVASISVYASAKSGTNSVQISTRLQRKSNGTWVNVATYYGSGTSSASISKTRTLTQKGEYRITTTVTLNGWENLTYYNYAFY